jgi:hypothetical protein
MDNVEFLCCKLFFRSDSMLSSRTDSFRIFPIIMIANSFSVHSRAVKTKQAPILDMSKLVDDH